MEKISIKEKILSDCWIRIVGLPVKIIRNLGTDREKLIESKKNIKKCLEEIKSIARTQYRSDLK